jgi:ATP-dependent Clp protease ATP-binding subunit ClpX
MITEKRCSFCGRTGNRRIISGDAGHICEECVGLCNLILAEEKVREDSDSTRWVRPAISVLPGEQ